MGIPNCLTIASTSYKNYFQYGSVPFTELINEKVLSLATNLSMVPLKLFLIVPTVSVPGLILCIAKMNVSDAAHTQTWQKIYNLHLMQGTD